MFQTSARLGLVAPVAAARAAPSSRPEAAWPTITSLVELHSDFVWRSLRRLGVPEHLVDDATQQVFLVASTKLNAIRPGSERSFLFATLSRVAAHARRSLARSREKPQATTQEIPDPSLAPDEIIAARQARALLDKVLAALSPELRTVFVLFELEELSTAEVAEITRLAPGTVASRLRRAREEFQKAAKAERTKALRITRRGTT
jgi:RNA polymerase sigma-70 factor, ECF subfamily